MIEILNRMYKSSELQRLFAAGFISQKALTYRIAYVNYLELKERKMSTKDSVERVAKIYGVTERTVYKIIKTFKDDEDRSTDSNKGRS